MNLVKVLNEDSISEVSRLAYALFPIYYDYVNPKHVQDYLDKYQSVQALKDQIDHEFIYYLVKENNGETAGYLGLELLSNKVKISKIYLDPAKRGKGLGQEIMNWIKRWARDNSMEVIELFVMQENKPAIAFYLKEGFIITGEFQEKFDSGEVEYNHIMTFTL